MGMFDSVYVRCPSCGAAKEFQSKVGLCNLIDYDLSNAPAGVLGELDGSEWSCGGCGADWRLRVQTFATVDRV